MKVIEYSVDLDQLIRACCEECDGATQHCCDQVVSIVVRLSCVYCLASRGVDEQSGGRSRMPRTAAHALIQDTIKPHITMEARIVLRFLPLPHLRIFPAGFVSELIPRPRPRRSHVPWGE